MTETTVNATPTSGRTLSIVIPVFNSEQTIGALVDRLGEVLPQIADSYEAILVNDASRDGSWEVVRECAERCPWVRGINFTRNYGQHNALLCGIRAAKMDTIVTMDDDLQHPPEEIHKLLAVLDEGYDVAYGTPERLQHSGLRNVASWVTKLALKSAMGADVARQANAFRAFRTQMRLAFERYRSPNVSIDVLLTWGTTRFGSVAVNHQPRAAGVSNYTVGKLITHAFNMMTGFSTVPLQVATWTGFAFTLVGIAIFAYAILNFLLRGSIPGFTFLAAAIAMFSGAQMFALGMIGEYLARVYFRTMDKPEYVVRERTDEGEQA